jgi:acetyl-CoA C-acetyltransferase
METPVLVGVAHLEQRITEAGSGKEPVQLMIDAVQQAALDAQCPQLLASADSVRVIRGVWPYQNPAKAVADAIGCNNAETTLTPYGGNYVQTTLNQSALDIQQGRADIIVMTGAECGYSQAKAAKAQIDLGWQALPGTPDRMIGEEKPMRHEFEAQLKIGRPIQVYPMFEIARRHHLKETPAEHIQRVSELWAGFSALAAQNPDAWIKRQYSAEEIRTPSASNRPVSFPYPKLMNSNNNVDQGAALILCSASKAKALGIPESLWVYPHTGTDAHDHLFVSNRDTLYGSPAIRIAGNRALELASLSVADLDRVDVYSCFPSAVQVAAAELGLDMTKPLTVTGGLTFGGGPLNNYVMHSIARMANLLREQPGDKGLITANGGYLTKHAFGVYSTDPPAKPFQHQDLQAEVNAMPKREVVADHLGTATVESYTVMYNGSTPNIGHLACLRDDGVRTWANCEDADTLQAMLEEEFCGRQVHLADNLAAF